MNRFGLTYPYLEVCQRTEHVIGQCVYLRFGDCDHFQLQISMRERVRRKLQWSIVIIHTVECDTAQCAKTHEQVVGQTAIDGRTAVECESL